MDGRNSEFQGGYRPLPKPVNLDAPKFGNGSRRPPASPRPPQKPKSESGSDGYGGRTRVSEKYAENADRDRGGYGDRGNGPRPEPNGRYGDRGNGPRPEPHDRRDIRDGRGGGDRRPRPPRAREAAPARRRPPPRRAEAVVRRRGISDFIGVDFSTITIPPIWKNIAVVAIGLVTIVAVGIILIANAMADNALAVYVDDEHVGYVEIFANWDSGIFHEQTVQELQRIRGVGVIVEQTVRLEPTRAAQAEILTQSAMISQITRHNFTYKFQAFAIYVWDSEVERFSRQALMRSMADVEATREELARRFRNNNTVDFWFEPDWQVRQIELDNDDIPFSTPQEAFSNMDRRIRAFVQHRVQSGENLTRIVNSYQADMTETLRNNPNVDPNNIMVGEVILLLTTEPLLTVITVDEVSEPAVLERDVVEELVSSLPTGRTRIRQEGRDGQVVRVTRIYRRNGNVFEEVVEDREVLVQSEPRIVEVGQ